MFKFTYWILYNREDRKKSLIIKTETEKNYLYSDICSINKLNSKNYLYEVISDEGLKSIIDVFFNFCNENLKSKYIDLTNN